MQRTSSTTVAILALLFTFDIGLIQFNIHTKLLALLTIRYKISDSVYISIPITEQNVYKGIKTRFLGYESSRNHYQYGDRRREIVTLKGYIL